MTQTSELSSLSTALDDLTKRIGLIGQASEADPESNAIELYEIERILTTAQRRLEKLLTHR